VIRFHIKIGQIFEIYDAFPYKNRVKSAAGTPYKITWFEPGGYNFMPLVYITLKYFVLASKYKRRQWQWLL